MEIPNCQHQKESKMAQKIAQIITKKIAYEVSEKIFMLLNCLPGGHALAVGLGVVLNVEGCLVHDIGRLLD